LKKILFITYYWPPSGGAGVQRSLKFVKYLSEFGVLPVVLTVDEKFASYPLLDETLTKEIPAAINIYRTRSFEALKILSLFTSMKNIPHGGFANSNKEKPFQKFLRFMRGNLFIPDARIGWINFAVSKASEIIEREKIDTIFITSPPHSSQLIGLRLKKRLNIRWIADMRDPWTDIYYYNDLLHTERSKRKDAKLESEVLINSDEVITVSRPIEKMFLSKSAEISPDKFHVIPNGFDESDFPENVVSADKYFQITYVGSIADSYAPDVFFEMMRKAMDDFPAVSFRMRFVGSMPDSIKQLIVKNRLMEISEFVSHVSHDKAVTYMLSSTALLLLIPEVVNNEGILTGKLFEYLASRRPIIGLGPVHGEASAILNECTAGKMFHRRDSLELYSYFKTLILQWQEKKDLKNINQNYQKYSRRELTKKLAAIILKLPE